MKLGKIKKAGVGLVAAAALAGGTAVAGAGIAAADPPDLGVSQEANNGQTDVTVETTDSNSGISVCFPVLASGETGLNLLIAYNDGDYGEIASILTSGDNLEFGSPASNDSFIGISALPNPSTSTFTVDDGVYFLVGACVNPTAQDVIDNIGDLLTGDFSSILASTVEDVTIQPVIVPNGIGSLAPASAFGSTASTALPAIVSILGNGGLPGGSSDLLGGLSD